MRQVAHSSPFPFLIVHDIVLGLYILNLYYGFQVTELKPEWLVEIAPHYYQMKDVEDRKILSLSLKFVMLTCLFVCLACLPMHMFVLHKLHSG